MAFWTVKNLTFSYPKGEPVLRGITSVIHEGETVALLGPNGSGKTTLGKVLMGILKPCAGQVLLAGRSVSDYTLGEMGAKVGYIFQNPEKQIFTSSVREEISFGLRYRGHTQEEIERRVKEMLDYFELSHRAGAFPFNLSQGEKQRLAIAAILALEPAFVIFDEPTTGLDMRRKEKLAMLLVKIRERGTGYILISHDRTFSISYTERCFNIREGKLYESNESGAKV